MSETSSSFTGFPDEGLQFLADLAENNNREWFNAHKSIFVEQLQIPAQAFVDTLGQRLQLISSAIRYDTRVNGQGSLMRIYRDIRFSKDKTPYKTYLAMVFWEGAGKKTECPGVYVRIDAGGVFMMVGQHTFPKPVLAAYRDAVVDDKAGAGLEKIAAAVSSDPGYEIQGQHYKRVPRSYEKDHPRVNWLLYNGVYSSTPAIPREASRDVGLVDICFDYAAHLSPLFHWLVEVNRTAE